MKKGFTLIEIVVVIAIIGVLILFLVLPNVIGIQDKAKEAAVKSVMHSVQLAVEAYNAENQSYPIASRAGLATLYEYYLKAGGYTGEAPKNPFTGKSYTDSDTAGRIIYDFDASTGAYTLTGYRRDGVTKLLELSNL